MPDPLDPLFALYRDAFPACERRGETDLRNALATDAYQIISRQHDQELIGFAILFTPPTRDFALLEYLAVQTNRRSAGIGRELVSSAIAAAGDRHLLTEVESASTDPASVRRQQFYQRCGFGRIAGLAYQLPLPGDPPPMELWIYSKTIASIEQYELARWLDRIYAEVYGQPSDDPRIQRMLAGLPPTVLVERS